MTISIHNATNPVPVSFGAAAPLTSGSAAGPDFQEMLLSSLEQVQSLDRTGQAAVEQVLIGGDVTQVEALSAVKQADLALRMLIQVRNRVIEGFNEIRQMQF